MLRRRGARAGGVRQHQPRRHPGHPRRVRVGREGRRRVRGGPGRATPAHPCLGRHLPRRPRARAGRLLRVRLGLGGMDARRVRGELRPRRPQPVRRGPADARGPAALGLLRPGGRGLPARRRRPAHGPSRRRGDPRRPRRPAAGMTADTTATGRPRFVVAYGGDKRSKAALRLGVVLAQSLDAHLDVVLVVRADDPFGAPYPPSGDVGPLVEEQALAWLDEARALVPDDVSLATHLRHDRSVAHGVLEAVAELGARLVVVGTAAGPQGVTVGSVARHLLPASPLPGALTPRGYKPAGRLRRIYCAVGTRPGAQLVV